MEISVNISSSLTITLSAFLLMSFMLAFFLAIAAQHPYKMQKQSDSLRYLSSLINIHCFLVSYAVLLASFGYIGFNLALVKEVFN